MAAGPEALKKLLIRLTDLETEWERIWQTLQEEELDKELGFYSFSEAAFPWDKRIRDEIWRRIDEWPYKG